MATLRSGLMGIIKKHPVLTVIMTFILLIIVVVFIRGIFSPIPGGSLEKTVEAISEERWDASIAKNTMTYAKKLEICNDLQAYFEWCYDNGVSINDCTGRAHEKVLRLYRITNAQLSEVLKSC